MMTTNTHTTNPNCIRLVQELLSEKTVAECVSRVLCVNPVPQKWLEKRRAAQETRKLSPALQSGWCIAELTDGRITGFIQDSAWLLSIDEFPGDGPQRLNADRSDWWRIRSLRIFNEAEELRITGDDGLLTGVRLRDDAQGADETSHPRDRRLIVDTGLPDPKQFNEQIDGVPGPRKPGRVLKEKFVRVTTPAYRTHVVPTPGNTAESLRDTRTVLAVREYFAEVNDTGAVGVQAHRLTGFVTENSRRSS